MSQVLAEPPHIALTLNQIAEGYAKARSARPKPDAAPKLTARKPTTISGPSSRNASYGRSKKTHQSHRCAARRGDAHCRSPTNPERFRCDAGINGNADTQALSDLPCFPPTQLLLRLVLPVNYPDRIKCATGDLFRTFHMPYAHALRSVGGGGGF